MPDDYITLTLTAEIQDTEGGCLVIILDDSPRGRRLEIETLPDSLASFVCVSKSGVIRGPNPHWALRWLAREEAPDA